MRCAVEETLQSPTCRLCSIHTWIYTFSDIICCHHTAAAVQCHTYSTVNSWWLLKEFPAFITHLGFNITSSKFRKCRKCPLFNQKYIMITQARSLLKAFPVDGFKDHTAKQFHFAASFSVRYNAIQYNLSQGFQFFHEFPNILIMHAVLKRSVEL